VAGCPRRTDDATPEATAMKVLSVVGARPQFVKAFPVSRALRARGEEVLVHTGQHYDEELSEVFFAELGIPDPDYHLGVGSGSHAVQTARAMERLDPIVAAEDPDALLVYGDTNSTVAAAMVGAKRDTAVVHVEAGLRSYDREMPEEVNRVVTDHVADLLLSPTERGAANLSHEGLADRTVVTGDVMYDALLWARDRASDATTVLADHDLTPGEYVLATVHRAKNTDDPARLAAILDGLGAVPETVVLPVHPRTEAALRNHDLWDRACTDLQVVDPVGYLPFVRLLDGARRIATDSGGVQKEAFFLDTPCVTLREETEWVETVDAGWNELVGCDARAITTALTRDWPLGEKPHPYGDGDAASHVADAVEAFLAGNEASAVPEK
jgi:UDP-N-acetylglucosamine 2-epimerase (non-hydrolysing)